MRPEDPPIHIPTTGSSLGSAVVVPSAYHTARTRQSIRRKAPEPFGFHTFRD
ncbi:MAG TPA: hypothetical protein VK975_01455 [Acidimicrobiales bacterium]|nr:hypothetical protein [Acidimicrobiales bacterium]